MEAAKHSGWQRIRQFFSDERQRLIGYVRGLIDDAADRDAEDIVQDVAFRIFEMGDVGAPIEHLGAYVYQALRNRVVDSFRRRRPLTSLDETIDQDEELRLADILADRATDLPEQIERDDMYGRAVELVRSLPERDQAVIIATEIEGFTFAELSDRWGVPIGTLLSQKSRALGKIRTALRSLAFTDA